MRQEWSRLPEARNPCPAFWDHVLDTWISSSLQSQPSCPTASVGGFWCPGGIAWAWRRAHTLTLPSMPILQPLIHHIHISSKQSPSEGPGGSDCSCSPRIFFLSAVFVQRIFPMSTGPRTQSILNWTPHDISAKNQLPFNGPTLGAEASESGVLRVSLIVDLSIHLGSLDKGLAKDGQGSGPHQNSALSTPHPSLDPCRGRQQCPTPTWKPRSCSRGWKCHPECSLRIPRLALLPWLSKCSFHSVIALFLLIKHPGNTQTARDPVHVNPWESCR